MDNDQQPTSNEPAQPSNESEPYSNIQLMHERDLSRAPFSARELFAWFAIIGVVLLHIAMAIASSNFSEEQAKDEKIDISDAVISGKLMFFASRLSNQPQDIASLDKGSVQHRLANAILAGELNSTTQALKQIDKLDEDISAKGYIPTESQQRLREIVVQILTSRPAEDSPDLGNANQGSAISADDENFLREQLPWFGDLALHPKSSKSEERKQLENSAQNLALGIFAIGFVALAWLIVGLIVGIIVIYFVVTKKVVWRFPVNPSRSVVYLETFAIWMVVFFGTQIGLSLMAGIIASQNEIEADQAGEYLLWFLPFVFLGSLVILVWPILNGVSFAEMRKDIGWTSGKGLVEFFCGLYGYLASVPLLLLGIVLTVIVTAIVQLFTPAPEELAGRNFVAHPIQEMIASHDWSVILLTFFLACVCAPIVEETMFRGVFYRYLRDRSSNANFATSVTFACLVNGLIFSAMHPQGIIGVPVLTSLAVSLSLIRQWRGSLWASIFVHGIHNFAATCVVLFLLS